jgi:hypothetical protein
MIEVKPLAKNLLTRKQRVLCVGLSKTGTTTFMEACKILGYRHKSMGFDDAFVNRRMLPIYLAAIRHDSFDDYPWFFLYRYFDRHFPSTRFVLTVRSSTDIWYQSFLGHERRGGGGDLRRHAYGLSSPARFEKHFRDFYERHNQAVRDYFRSDPRFIELCWENGDDWRKLCDFLDKPVPQVDFPHANKGPTSPSAT